MYETSQDSFVAALFIQRRVFLCAVHNCLIKGYVMKKLSSTLLIAYPNSGKKLIVRGL